MQLTSPNSGASNETQGCTGTTGECQAIVYLFVSNLYDFITNTRGNHFCFAKCHEFPLTLIIYGSTSFYLSSFFSKVNN